MGEWDAGATKVDLIPPARMGGTDWTAFRSTNAVRELYRAAAEHIGKVAQQPAVEIVAATLEDVLTLNRTEPAIGFNDCLTLNSEGGDG